MLPLRGRDVKPPLVFDSTLWRKRAEEMRTLAQEASDQADKERFLELATKFEQFSERAGAFTKKRPTI